MNFFNKQNRCFLFLLIVVFFCSVSCCKICSADYNFYFDSGLFETAEGTGHAGATTQFNSLPSTISTIIQVALSFVGIIFLGLLIYGGYMWMTARGNEQQIEKAKSIIINTIIGLVIVVLAYAITAFIGNTLVPKS